MTLVSIFLKYAWSAWIYMYLFSEKYEIEKVIEKVMKLKKLLPKNENLYINFISVDGTPLPSSFILVKLVNLYSSI